MQSPTFKHSVLALALLQAYAAQAQTTPPAAAPSQPMTEVVVTANRWTASDRASVAGFSSRPLLQTPASVSAFTREEMQDLQIGSVTDAVRFDASVAESYNAVGYAEQFSIRGFALDNNTGYRKDGIPISGDAQIPMENKEGFEILRGVSGITAGVASPGGQLNFVTKRPTIRPLRSVTLGARERGTLYGAIDLGGRFEDKRFGYRINAAGERLRSYVRGADGERSFVSGAFDWQISPDALLQVDADFQKKSQITAPGYQLIRGVELPNDVDPKALLNDQPWTKPVETRTSNVGLIFSYQLGNGWSATVKANRHSFKRDDYTAFPYGCSNEGEGFYPGYCSNGDYDVYDYQSVGESKNPHGWNAVLQGQVRTGGVKHELTFGAAGVIRTDRFGDYVYDYAGYSNYRRNLVSEPAPGNPRTGPVYDRRNDNERALVVHDIMTLSPQWTLEAGLRRVEVERDRSVPTGTRSIFTLPSVALSFKPNANWMVYGQLAHGMEHGGTAEMGTANEQETLPPGRSRQVEFGAKGTLAGHTLSAALFQIEQGLEYVDDSNTFVRNGTRTHRGIEIAAQGEVMRDLTYSLSLMGLDPNQSGTGNPALEGKQVPNVPRAKSVALLEYAVPQVAGLRVRGVWQYSAKKPFDNENTVFAPSYSVYGLSALYDTRIGTTAVTLRASVDNVTNKFYWRDVTPLLGGYLFPGAPRTARVTAQFDF